MSRQSQRNHGVPAATSFARCDCGKRGFRSREAARQSLKRAGNRVRLCVCDRSHFWHATNEEKR